MMLLLLLLLDLELHLWRFQRGWGSERRKEGTRMWRLMMMVVMMKGKAERRDCRRCIGRMEAGSGGCRTGEAAVVGRRLGGLRCRPLWPRSFASGSQDGRASTGLRLRKLS